MCKANRLVYITTAGGYIGQHDFGSSYLEGLSTMLGIPKVVKIWAEGLDVEGVDVEQELEKTREKMKTLL